MTKSISRALDILSCAINPSESATVAGICEELSLPRATVYRQVEALQRAGFLVRESKGRLAPGMKLLERFDPGGYRKLLAKAARPHVESLSQQFEMTSHLGVLEDDMVTYLVKVESGTDELFTVESKKLEGYCSGIGKMLLSSLSENEIDEYLSTAPFPRLTVNTLVEAGDIRSELGKIRKRGYSLDQQEFDEDIFCVAVPVLGSYGSTTAALSLSGRPDVFMPQQRKKYLAELQERSAAITAALSTIRLAPHEGQKPRLLQLNATSFSS